MLGEKQRDYIGTCGGGGGGGDGRIAFEPDDCKQNYHYTNDMRYMNHSYTSQQQPQQVVVQSQNFETNVHTNHHHLGSYLVQSRTPIQHETTVTLPESPASTATGPTDEINPSETVKLPENLESLPKTDEFPIKRSRWNTNEEILSLLLNFSKHDAWQSKDVVIRPESGSMLMYSRKKVRYRRDGYCWKKRKDGKTTREDHMKLKVQGVECIYGCYVHSAVLPTFHRRCYWLLQNPDIVLVHYLNVPYPDDSKLAALIPNIAFWTEKKEWTREELLLQLKPMYEYSGYEGGKENQTEELKLNRVNQHVSTFIDTMITQLLEKQRYVRTALANSVECGCGNRKCLGAARCTRPIRRISSVKKAGKRGPNAVKIPSEKRTTSERNSLKTNLVRKFNTVENQWRTMQSSTNTFYPTESVLAVQTAEDSQQMQQIVRSSHISQTHDLQKLHQQSISPPTGKTVSDYDRRVDNYNFTNMPDNREYHSYSAGCSLSEQYVPNNEIEINNDETKELNLTDNVNSLLPYNHDDQEYVISDTTDGSDSNSYSTIHHQGSPNDSFTSVDDTNGDLLDDLIMNVDHGYDNPNEYANTDGNLYELIIQLSQKEKKTSCSNSSLITCEKIQQYDVRTEDSGNTENYTTIVTDSTFPVSDANGNFLNSCSRYSTGDDNGYSIISTDMDRMEHQHSTNYSEAEMSFVNDSNEFTEKSTSCQSMQESNVVIPGIILELAPEWSYCEGGTKLLIIGPWYFQSEYAVLFDSYSVPATLVQAGVLKCYCPEHAVGLASLQVMSGGSIISNTVAFEYKRRSSYDENPCHTYCNIKSEKYNQYTYENDTLLKFILIHRIEAIQDDAYTHSPASLINEYEDMREKVPV